MHYLHVERERWFAWHPIYIADFGWTWFRPVYRSGHLINGGWIQKWYEPAGPSLLERLHRWWKFGFPQRLRGIVW